MPWTRVWTKPDAFHCVGDVMIYHCYKNTHALSQWYTVSAEAPKDDSVDQDERHTFDIRSLERLLPRDTSAGRTHRQVLEMVYAQAVAAAEKYDAQLAFQPVARYALTLASKWHHAYEARQEGR